MVQIRCISAIEQVWAKLVTIITFQNNFKRFTLKRFALFFLTRILATKESGYQKNLFVDSYDVFLDRFQEPILPDKGKTNQSGSFPLQDRTPRKEIVCLVEPGSCFFK
jgi:hypothetical protein